MKTPPDASYYSLNHAKNAAVDEYFEIATKSSQSATGRSERSAVYGIDLYEKRGLSDSEPDDKPRTGGDADEVRPASEMFSKGTPERNVHRYDAAGYADSALSDDTAAGGRADGLPDRADGGDAGGERGTEGIRPDEMGTDAEQYPGVGRGDRFVGADHQLNKVHD